MKIFSENFADFKFKKLHRRKRKKQQTNGFVALPKIVKENFLLFSYQSFSLFFLRKIFTAGSQRKKAVEIKIRHGDNFFCFILLFGSIFTIFEYILAT